MRKYILLQSLLFTNIRIKNVRVKNCLVHCVFLCCLCLFCPLLVQAGDWQAGFRTIGVWEPDQNLRLDVAIWYPATRMPARVEYGSIALRVARNVKAAEGRFPLILFMHGSGETRFTWHVLAGRLARQGFVVVAPTFTGDNANDMRYIMSYKQLTSKGHEMSLFVTWLKQYPELTKTIDMSRIGVFGAGSGADAALLLANGRLDAQAWPKYCQEAESVRKSLGLGTIPDPYCQPFPKQSMQNFAESLPLLEAKVTHDVLDVRALALAFPVYGMFFSKASLQAVSSKVLMLTHPQDVFFLPELHTARVMQALPKEPTLYALVEEDYPLFDGEYTRFFSKSIGYAKSDEIRRLDTSKYPVVQRVVDFFVKQMQ